MNEKNKPSLESIETGSDSIDSILNILNTLNKYRSFLLITLILATIVSIFYALSSNEVYRAEMTIKSAQMKNRSMFSQVADQLGGIVGSTGLGLSTSVADGGDYSTAVATLYSRSFIKTYISENTLMPILFADDWDKDKKTWKNSSDQPTDIDAYKAFSGQIFLKRNEQNGIISFAVEWSDPIIASKLANDLIDAINKYLQEKAIQDIANNIKYLEKELEQTSIVNAQSVVYKIIEEQTKAIMMANVREEYAFEVIDPAIPPDERIKPKRRLIVQLGVGIGLMLGLLCIYLIEVWKNLQTILRQKNESLGK